MTSQKQINETDVKLLEEFGKTFFGFGSWKADYWVIGLEERGATEDELEFRGRFDVWKKMKPDGLVDLRRFFKNCGIKKPKTPNWENQTWKALHSLLKEAGIKIGELNESNSLWGGSENVAEGSGHVALIEAMPFPAPSRKEWPYANWNFRFMETRKACENRFRKARLEKILLQVKNCRPKVVIDYCNAWQEIENNGVKFSSPVLFRKAQIVDSCFWLAPVMIAGARPFCKLAKKQTAKQLRVVASHV